MDKDTLISKLRMSNSEFFTAVGNLVAYNTKDTTYIRLFGDSPGIPNTVVDKLKQNLIISGNGSIGSIFLRATPLKRIIIDLNTNIPSFNYINLSASVELEDIQFKSVNFSGVTSLRRTFADLNELKVLDLRGLDLSNVTDMHAAFSGCTLLEHIYIGNCNLGKVTDLGYAFWACENLVDVDIGVCNLDSCRSANSIFSDCYKLEKLDLSGVQSDRLATVREAFYKCKRLKELIIGKIYTLNDCDTRDIFTGSNKELRITAI